jgi:hypothetical protein
LQSLSGIKVLIAGTIRDGSSCLEKSIESLDKAFNSSSSIKWLIIESDSSDNTVGTLEAMSTKVKDFNFMSLGNLAKDHPKRTDRIAVARNEYLKRFQADPQFSDCTHLVVADLDGVNDKLSSVGINSSWSYGLQNVYTANQSGPYYDIWALRHEYWSPNDCWKELDFYKRHYKWPERALSKAIFSRMIRINQSAPMIKVDSAFGGLAIYPRDSVVGLNYIGIDSAGEEICEHVLFSKAIRAKGFEIYVNPMMINTDYTDFSVELKLWNKLKRIFRYPQKQVQAFTKK